MASGVLTLSEREEYLKNKKKKQMAGVLSLEGRQVFPKEKKKEEPKQKQKYDSSTMSPLTKPKEEKKYNLAPVNQSGYKKELAKPTGITAKTSPLDGYLKAGALSDGYDFGDLTKTVFGTLSSVEQNAARGVSKATEGILDTGLWGVGKIAELAGQDKLANTTKKIIAKDITGEGKQVENIMGLSSINQAINDILNGRVPYKRNIKNLVAPTKQAIKNTKEDFTVEQAIDDFLTNYQTEEDKKTKANTVLGEKAEGLVQSGAQMLGTQALQATTGIPWWVTTGLSTFGNQTEEAFNEGANYNQAGLSALVSAIGEVLTEKISGGISYGGKTLDKGLKSQLTKGISNKVLNTLTQFGIDVVGEGAEEVLSNIITRLGKKLTYEKDKTWKELLTSEEAMDSYVQDFIGGAIMGGVGNTGNVVTSIKTGRNYETGLTQAEQKVVDTEVENRIGDKKVSAKERTKIEDQVKKDLEKGYISQDTISKALNEDYKQIEDYETKQKRLEELLDKKVGETTNRENSEIKALQEELDKIDINTLRNQINQNTATKIGNNSILQATYNENANKSQKYNNDLSKYNEKEQKIIQKAIDSGVLNNTNKTHDFIDMIAKISSDKNVDFDFTNNENLKNSGFALDTDINGFIQDGKITLNIDSKNALNSVVGHEITHVLEDTDLYQTLQESIEKYAKTKGVNIDERLAKLEDLYKDVKNANVRNELTSDLVGEYLFTDTDFVKNLSTEQPNLFKRIYDEIKYMLKVVTAGSKEERELLKVKKAFEDAYRDTRNVKKGTQYSIGDNGKIQVQIKGEFKEFDNYFDYAKEISKDNNELAKQLLFKYYTENYDIPNNSNETTFYHGTDATFDYDGLKVMDFDEHTMDRNYGDYFYITPDKSFANIYGRNIAQFIIPNNKILSLEEYRKLNKSDNELFKDYWAIEMPDKEYVVKDVNKIIEYSKQKAKEFINQQDNKTKYSLSQDNQGRELSKQQQEYFKDSKVRDDEGRLLEVFHGTTNGGFNIFDSAKLGNTTKAIDSQLGFHFTDNLALGEMFSDESIAEGLSFDKGNNSELKKVYLNMEKPLNLNTLKYLNEIDKNEQFVKDLYYVITGETIKTKEQLEEAKEEMKYNSQWNTLENVKDELALTPKAKERLIELGYDGIIQSIQEKDIMALEEYGEDDFEGNEYVVFKSNQIKNIDNTNPTTNDDIRYSIGNELQNVNNGIYGEDIRLQEQPIVPISQAIETQPIAPVETQVQEVQPTTQEIEEEQPIIQPIAPVREENPLTISRITPEDANTTPKLPQTKASKGEGRSRVLSNITETSQILNEEQKAIVRSAEDIKYYDPVTNEKALDKAFKRLNDGGRNETLNWMSKDSKNADSTDVAEGWILMKQYADNNDIDGLIATAKKMKEIGTTAGQTVQAFNIMERLTPEGMVAYAQSELLDAYNEMVKNKSQKWIDKYRSRFELTGDEVQFIMDNMKEISQMEDGYDKQVKLAEIQKIMTDKLPPEKGQRIKSWMRLSMLFNPKTQVRNVVGNAIIAPVNYFGDIFSSAADYLVARKTNVRTTGNINVKAMLKGLKDGAYQSTMDYRKGINTRDMEGNRFEIGQSKSFSQDNLIGKSLNMVEGMLNYVMDAGDRVFSQSAFENSLQNQMKLNNVTKPTQEMIDIARKEALSRTWNDNNNYTNLVLNIRKNLNRVGTKNFGLGDVLIPFAKTPANLTKAIVDYSPVGFVNTLVKGNNLRKAIETNQFTPQMQHEFAQSLGKATAGTMLYVLGAALASAGVISGESDEDKDTANFLKNTLGVNSYSIKLGNKSFTFDWAQPVAAPLAITANLKGRDKEGQALAEGIIASMDTASSVLLEQSFLTGIREVLDDNNGIVNGMVNEVLKLPARAIPTFSKQITDLVDGTQRQTYVKGHTIKSAVNAALVKIPGVSKTLAPSVDTMGRDIEKYGGKNNPFNVFLNPANVSTENISESAQEIYDVYKETGDKTIMPRVAPYSVTTKNKSVELSPDQRAKYQRESGKIIDDAVKELSNNSDYNKLSAKDKAEVLNNITNYAYNKARKDVLGIDMAKTYNKVNEYVSKGGSIADYYLDKDEINYSLENDDKYQALSAFMDYDDYTNYAKNINKIKKIYTSENGYKKEQRKQKVVDYIEGLNLSIPQKVMLLKEAGGYGIGDYKNYMYNYINNLDLTKTQKEDIYYQLYPKKSE